MRRQASIDTMRVLFFTQGENVPSSRFRVMQFLPYLESTGMVCSVAVPYPSTSGDVRWSWVRGAGRELFRPFHIASRIRQLRLMDGQDLAVIQKPLTSYPTSILERIVSDRAPVVFDLDDALYHNLFGLDRRRIRRIMDLSRRIIVGNRYLADFAAEPDKTDIIPTVVDTQRYAVRPDPDGPFTIGWTGLSSNLRQLRPIAAVLERVLEQTGGRLLVLSDRLTGGWLKDLPVTFQRWSPETEVAALASVHVGIMPLADTPYNRGKCAFKLIQYMARGIPVVASPVGANPEVVGTDAGFLSADQPAWRQALLALAGDPLLRKAMGRAARDRVEQHYSLDTAAPRYAAVLRRAAAGGR